MDQSNRSWDSCVLVVDDERVLRTFAKCALESAGYRVLTAGNAVEALLVCNEYPGTIDLLFTDVEMGKSLNGIELASCFNLLRPETRILITSGTYLPESIHGKNGRGPIWDFLPKPFSLQGLLRAVDLAIPRVRSPLPSARVLALA
ncbi:MAG: multi-sensor hybrid histidine kinase [Fibrobacteres bacterium]|nr:multi-sensor hybrid histidine kinase [Fibrobacterota bacterium]